MLRQIIDPNNESSPGFIVLYRWGMLVALLVMLGWILNAALRRGDTDWQNIAKRCAIPTLLLVNHLAFSFKWPRRVQMAWYGVAAVALGLVIWIP